MSSQRPIVWRRQGQNIHVNKKAEIAIKEDSLVFKEIFSKILE